MAYLGIPPRAALAAAKIADHNLRHPRRPRAVQNEDKIAARAEQYAITDWSNASGMKWTGNLYKHSNLHMVGEIKRDGKTGNLAYVESTYDRNRGDTMINQYAAQCREQYTDVAPPSPPVVVAPAPSRPLLWSRRRLNRSSPMP
jgi:hypothetical protein